MGKKSKTKGGRFENKFCKKFSLIWSQRERDDIFIKNPRRRSPSGRIVQWCGDIIQIADDYPNCPFVFELKHYQDFRILTSVFKNNGRIVKWWQQLLNECPPNRIPILICHRDYDLTYVLMRDEDYGSFHPRNNSIFLSGPTLVDPHRLLLTFEAPFFKYITQLLEEGKKI